MRHTADATACELSVDGNRNVTETQPKRNRNATADDIKLALDSRKLR